MTDNVKEEVVTKAKTAPKDAESPVVYAAPVVEDENAFFYIHLANGDVVRAAAEDVPARGGTNAPHGHWNRSDGTCHTIIGVYPVETTVKG